MTFILCIVFYLCNFIPVRLVSFEITMGIFWDILFYKYICPIPIKNKKIINCKY